MVLVLPKRETKGEIPHFCNFLVDSRKKEINNVPIFGCSEPIVAVSTAICKARDKFERKHDCLKESESIHTVGMLQYGIFSEFMKIDP